MNERENILEATRVVLKSMICFNRTGIIKLTMLNESNNANPMVILRDCPVLYLCIVWLGNIMTPVEGHINSLRSYPQWWVPGCESIYQLLSHLLESFRKKTGLLMDGCW